jgi:hypothetical protein
LQNKMEEIIVNLHMHTRYSDGSGSHNDIAQAAVETGLDAVIVTDHNVLVQGFEADVKIGTKRVLMLIGEEVHDQGRYPQKNHLLVLGAKGEMATFADDPQTLIRNINDSGGLSFIAHPNDPSAPSFNEPNISWEDWSVDNYTGLEIWNGMSELKTYIPTKFHGVIYSLFPSLVARHPSPNILQKWDKLLEKRRVVAIGGSDAHALRMRFGPFMRIIYPYNFHFRAINTHIFLPDPLTRDFNTDKQMIFDALARGHCFIGYDLPFSTRGFRFTARGGETAGIMGDEIQAHSGVTLQVFLPSFAEIRLIKDGKVVRTVKKAQALTHITQEPGVYRIEAFRNYLGRRRGWVFSNPIYLR